MANRLSWPGVKRCLLTISGILYAWVVLGNVVGHILAFRFFFTFWQATDRLVLCYPSFSLGGYYTNCENWWADLFWLVTVKIPGLVWNTFSIAGGFTLISLDQLHLRYFINSLPFWALGLFIFGFIMFPGMLYWKQQNIRGYYLLNTLLVLLILWGIYAYYMG